MNVKLQPHPIAERFPMMPPDQFARLKEDIRVNGLLEPVWLLDGQIIDGRNRHLACVELNIETRTREYVGDSPVAFVWSMNGSRRQLSKSQLAALAVSFLPDLKAEAKKRLEQSQFISKSLNLSAPTKVEGPGEAIEVAAKIFGVSRTYVDDARTVAKASPQLFEEVREGKITIGTAAAVVRGRISYDKRPPAHPDRNRPRPERIAELRQLAERGANRSQIAAAMGVSEQHVSDLAHAEGIKFHSVKAPRAQARRIIVESVNSLSGLVLGLQFLDFDEADFSAEEIGAWAQSIADSVREITRVRKQLESLQLKRKSK